LPYGRGTQIVKITCPPARKDRRNGEITQNIYVDIRLELKIARTYALENDIAELLTNNN